MKVNSASLKKFVEENPKLVSRRPAGDGIYVLKYKKTVFYDGLWNDYLEECRGTIVDEDYNIVSYPFTKVYNYGVEAKSPVLDGSTKIKAYRKVNGFMVAVTWHKDDILVSTTGSTDSDYVKMAREFIDRDLDLYRAWCKEYSTYTFMFECVHKDDPHIIPEVEGMYLLGHRPKFFGSPIGVSDDMHKAFNCHSVEALECTLDTLRSLAKTVKHEGFVFYTLDGMTGSKIKSPHYLVSKFVARNPRTDKLMRPDVKKSLDEEYYPLIDAIQANIEAYTAMDEQTRLSWVREFLSTQ